MYIIHKAECFDFLESYVEPNGFLCYLCTYMLFGHERINHAACIYYFSNLDSRLLIDIGECQLSY
jgi:hypothetical protein